MKNVPDKQKDEPASRTIAKTEVRPVFGFRLGDRISK
jgi:hypothetical protein